LFPQVTDQKFELLPLFNALLSQYASNTEASHQNANYKQVSKKPTCHRQKQSNYITRCKKTKKSNV